MSDYDKIEQVLLDRIKSLADEFAEIKREFNDPTLLPILLYLFQHLFAFVAFQQFLVPDRLSFYASMENGIQQVAF